MDDQQIFRCPDHMSDQEFQDGQTFSCICGVDIPLSFTSDIRIFPGVEFIKSMYNYLLKLENQNYNGSFIIIGNILRLLERSTSNINIINLSDFRSWRMRARIHQRAITDDTQQRYRTIIFRIKEKCVRNDGHPSQAICNTCKEEEITQTRIKKGEELCLSRLFGYAIDEFFDGVHHGHEVADIRYEDGLLNSQNQLQVGIHLKSRKKSKPLGLGRSVSCIKGLYTQYCHSAYLSSRSQANLNIIGISIPNRINVEVRNDFLYISEQLGYPLIIVDEEDWLKILDTALEKSFFFVRNI